MRYSRLIAIAAFFGLVPGGIFVAYVGYRVNLYPYSMIPIVFGVVFALVIGGLFGLLPIVRDRLD